MTQVGNCDIEGVYFQNYVRKVIDKYNYYYYKFDDNYNFFLPNSKFLIRCSSNIMMFDRSNCYDMMSSWEETKNSTKKEFLSWYTTISLNKPYKYINTF